jgi:hypothetical protein
LENFSHRVEEKWVEKFTQKNVDLNGDRKYGIYFLCHCLAPQWPNGTSFPLPFPPPPPPIFPYPEMEAAQWFIYLFCAIPLPSSLLLFQQLLSPFSSIFTISPQRVPTKFQISPQHFFQTVEQQKQKSGGSK